MPCSQSVFDGLLAGQRPVHRRIQVILVAAGDAEQLTQGAGGRFGAQPTRGRQLGARRDHLGHQHRGHQIAPPRGRRVDQLLHAQRPRGAQHRGDMPVRQAAGDLKRLAHIQLRRLPLSARASASTLCSGQCDRLARVRFFTLPPSR